MSLGGGGGSTTEQTACDNSPMLNIAAAGNSGTDTGNDAFSYPASYSSVVSVAAIDSANAVATFSQKNSEVDIAAPGVAVLSTVPRGAGYEASVAAPGGAYEATGMEGSPNGTATGTLVNCGLGDSPCAASGGAICLIQRGDISFADKVVNCQSGGGSAAVIYNNADALFSGTLGGTSTNIPSMGVSGVDGAALLGAVGSEVTVTLVPGDYAHYDGTSMATPHVAGVAALVWGQPTLLGCTKAQVRSALENTALDLGATGRDDSYGHGLIQAKAAIDSLEGTCGGGGPGPNQPPSAGFASACTDLTCDFSDNSSDADGSVSSWSWDFGDGGSSSAQNPSHTYAADGSYTVTLTVTDDDGAPSDIASQSVTVSGGGVSNQNPVASFTESCTDLDCSFTDTSTDADGSIASWSWEFGDGNTSIGQNPNHSYGSGGTFTVTLTVTDNEGATDSTSSDVTVSSGGGGDPVLTTQKYNSGRNWYVVVSSDTNFSGTFDNGKSCSNVSSCQSDPKRKNQAIVFTPDVGDPITIIW